jgi:hypothetical protein
MNDFERCSHTAPVNAVVRYARPIPPPRVRWSVVGPLLVGAVGVMLAAATLALFLMWRGSVAVQISQLRSELVTAQTTGASNGAGLSGMTRRLDGMGRGLTALQALVGGYTYVCSQDLTGPNGPAVFVFPCQQRG